MRYTQLYPEKPLQEEIDLTETFVIWGIRRNDMLGKPIKSIHTDERKVRKIHRELMTWWKRDFRNRPELKPELLAAKLNWEVQE